MHPAIMTEIPGMQENSLATEEDAVHRVKRKRPWNASCQLCKERKVRCDRARPKCSRCSQSEEACEYREREKPGIRTGYGRELEKRVLTLETVVQAQDHRIKELASSWHDRDPGLQNSLPQPNTEVISQHPPNLPKNPRSHQSQLWADHNQIPARSALRNSRSSQTSTTTQATQSPATTEYTDIHDASFRMYGGLPPPGLLRVLVDLYFQHINVWAPVFSKKTVIESLCEIPNRDEQDNILLHAIVATSLRFSSDHRLTPELRDHYHRTSSDRIQLYGLHNSNIRALQALLVLAIDQIGTSNGTHGYKLLAVIHRSVVQLGLNSETKPAFPCLTNSNYATFRSSLLAEPRSWTEDEERRRVFWLFYMLDRYATVAMGGFAFSIDEEDIDRLLPCREDLYRRNQPVETKWFNRTPTGRRLSFLERPENLGTFAFHCEILAILSRIHRFLLKPMDINSLADVEVWQGSYRQLDDTLISWHMGLPTEYADLSSLLRTTPLGTSPIGWILLHAAFNTTAIRLHSAAAYPAVRSCIFSASYSAMQRCFSSVANVSELCQYAIRFDLLDKLGPTFAFSLWVSARLLLVHGSTLDRDHELDPKIGFFVSALGDLGLHWEIAKRYHGILSRVLEEYQKTKLTAEEGDERVTPGTVQLLADMRRTAFDLDLLISHQPYKAVIMAPISAPAENKLACLDIFEFFNLPRVPLGDENNQQSTDTAQLGQCLDTHSAFLSHGYTSGTFMAPTPEIDWLSSQ